MGSTFDLYVWKDTTGGHFAYGLDLYRTDTPNKKAGARKPVTRKVSGRSGMMSSALESGISSAMKAAGSSTVTFYALPSGRTDATSSMVGRAQPIEKGVATSLAQKLRITFA